MLLWLCLWVTVVIADNTMQPAPENQMRPYTCGDEKVLLKVWSILSNLLDIDGQTVKAPSPDQVQYGLILIKKHILENQGVHNVDLQEKLFVQEAELAKYKGVFLHDNRSLKDLLDLEPIHNSDNFKTIFKYELPANDKPTCREEFVKLFQLAQEDYTRLANSPVCSNNNVAAWISPNSPSYFQSSLYKNHYNRINNPDLVSFTSENEYNAPISHNLNPAQADITTLEETQQPTRVINEQNKPITTNLQHIVKLTKDRFRLIGEDFAANLEHAKDVADKIRALYQSRNIPIDKPQVQDLTREQPPRDVDFNRGTLNVGSGNNQQPKPLLQANYINQRSYLNPFYNNVHTLPSYIRDSGVNQSYAITNIVQSQNTMIENSYTSPKPMFINSKYQPNPNFSTRNQGELEQQSYSNPANIKFYKYPNPYSIVANIPARTDLNRYPTVNNFNNNVYRNTKPNYAEGPKALQNDYPYQPSSINISYYTNFNPPNPEVSPIQSTYSTRNDNAFKQVIQNVNIPQPIYKENLNKDLIQNYKYTSQSHVRNHNVPNQLTQEALNYNNQPVIDKLADWIAGTNPTKLKSYVDNQGEIELTYLVKDPPPILYQPRIYYIKFRLPYQAFARHLNELLTPQSSRKSSDIELYKDLASQFNATVIPSDPSQIAKEDIQNLSDKRLVKATLINPNVPGKDNSMQSVDIINLINQTELDNANIHNPVSNNVAPNVEIPLQPPQ